MVAIRKSKRIVTICALVGILVIAASLLVPVTQAAAKTGKFRVVFVFTKMESIQVGDVEGHFVGMYEIKGLSSHENGEVAIYMDWGTFDTIEGFKGYFVLTLEDGSTQWAKYQGTSKPAQGGKVTLYEGTFEYIKGTGRFEGIEGSGSFTGKNFTPPDVVYVDYTGTYTLPRPGTAALAPGEFMASKVEDLVGIWETRFGGRVAYMQFKADGTLNLASTVEMLKERATLILSGTFWFEGTVFHMKDNHVYGTGTYEVRVQKDEDKPIHLSFVVIDDPSTGRVADLTEGMARVEP